MVWNRWVACLLYTGQGAASMQVARIVARTKEKKGLEIATIFKMIK